MYFSLIIDELLIRFLSVSIGLGIDGQLTVCLSLDAIAFLFQSCLGSSLLLPCGNRRRFLCFDTSLALLFCLLVCRAGGSFWGYLAVIGFAIDAIVTPWLWIIQLKMLRLQLVDFI